MSAGATYEYGYAPTTSNIPASTWTTAAAKSQHLGEIFFYNTGDPTTCALYKWSISGSTYYWQNVTSLYRDSSSAGIKINSDSITMEVSRAKQAEIFADYIQDYAPSASVYPQNTWTTDGDKEAHVGEIFHDTSTGKYYMWDCEGVLVKFGDMSSTESYRYDYVNILYQDSFSASGYRTCVNTGIESPASGKGCNYGGNGTENYIAGYSVFVPASTFDVYWHSDDGYSSDYWGFEIVSVEKTRGIPKTENKSQSWPVDATVGLNNLPKKHPYTDNEDYRWRVQTGLNVAGYHWVEIGDSNTDAVSAKLALTEDSFSTEISSSSKSLSSSIKQSIGEISLDVTGHDTRSTLTLKAGSATLSSKELYFEGFATFTSLSTPGATTIDGRNITTGYIRDSAQDPNMSLDLHTGEIIAKKFSLQSTYLTIEEDGDMISSDKTATIYAYASSGYVYSVTGNTANIEKGQLQINKYDSRRIVPSSITTESERQAYALNDSNYTQSSQYYGNYNYDRFINVSDGGLTFYLNNKQSIYESTIKPLDSYDSGTSSNKNLEIITRGLYVNRTSSAKGDGTILCRSIRMWDGNDEYYYDRSGFYVNGSSSIKGDLNLNNNDLEYVKDIIMDNGSYYNGGTIHNVNNLEADGKDEMTINAEGRGLNLWGLNFVNVNGDSFNGYTGWLTEYFGSGNGLVLKNGHGCDFRFLHGFLVQCDEWDW